MKLATGSSSGVRPWPSVARRGDQVELVPVASAGQARVAELDAEGVVAEHERAVARHPLRLMDGGGIAVGDVAVVDVAGRDVDAATVLQLDTEVTIGGARERFRGRRSGHPSRTALRWASTSSPMANPRPPASTMSSPSSALGPEHLPGAVVQVGNARAMAGSHDHVFAPAPCCAPVTDQGVAQEVGVAGRAHVAVALQPRHRPFDLAVAELVYGGALLRVALGVGCASARCSRDARRGWRRGRRRRSPGAASDHQPGRPSRGPRRPQRRGPPGAGSPAFRLRRRRAIVWSSRRCLPPGQSDEQAVSGLARDAGAELELRCRAGGECGADDAVSARLPRFAGGVEAEGLAGAGRADEHRDGATGLGDRPDGARLVGAQRWACVDAALDDVGRHRTAPQAFAGHGQLDGAALDGEDLWCCPAVNGDGDRLWRDKEVVGAGFDVARGTRPGSRSGRWRGRRRVARRWRSTR